MIRKIDCDYVSADTAEDLAEWAAQGWNIVETYSGNDAFYTATPPGYGLAEGEEDRYNP